MEKNLEFDSRYFWGAVACAIIYDVVSLAVYTFPLLQWPALVVIILAVVYLTIRDSRWLIILPLAELAWGSFGSSLQWFFGDYRVSIRMVLFCLCMVVGIVRLFLQKEKKLLFSSEAFGVFGALMLPVVWGVTQGFLKGNNSMLLFLDANGYLYLLYAPLWFIVLSRNHVRPLLWFLGGVIMALAMKTLLLLNIFVNDYQILNAAYLYLWIRDTRIGEITLVGESLYRIFIQSQIYIALAISAMAAYALRASRLSANFFLAAALFLAALIASLSRSFWLGVAVAVAGAVVMHFFTHRFSTSAFVRLGTRFVGIGIGSFIILFAAVTLPNTGVSYANLSGLFTSRVITSGADPAGASRLQQLPPLMSAIRSNVLLGSGFGATVSYNSSDPRIKTSGNPEGVVTTYAFEWGYFDQLLKLGLVAFALQTGALLYLLVQGMVLAIKQTDNSLPPALITGLLCLMVIHSTSPYLNHPLGLGYVALIAVLLLKSRVMDSHHETPHG